MISDHPKIAALQAERVKIDRLEETHRQRVLKVVQVRAHKDAWRPEAQQAARLELAIPSEPESEPDETEPVIDEAATAEFRLMRQQVDREEQVVLRQMGAEIEQEAGGLDVIPVSALHGNNVVGRSENMDWYRGTPLLYHLETVHIASDRNLVDVRFRVQWVIRPMSDKHPDYRGDRGP